MEKKMLARYPIGNPRRKWRQDNFVISLVNPGPMGLKHAGEAAREKARRGIETAKDAGFNFAEFCWSSREVGLEMVRAAERVGLAVSYQDLLRFGGMGYRRKQNLSPEENDLDGILRDSAAWRCITGLGVYDEPITEEQRKLARAMIDRVEEVRPGLFPGVVSDAGYIDRVADEVDPVTMMFDLYPFGNWGGSCPPAEGQLDNFSFWEYLEIGRRAARRIGAPYWFVYQGHELTYHPSFDVFTFPAACVMANAALLYGAKGLSCYIECDGVIDPETGGHGVYFEEQKELNRELAALGNTLMALECHRVIHDKSVRVGTSVKCATMEESALLTGELPHRISVSELQDAYGNAYLMVLNRDYKLARRYVLSLKEEKRIWRVASTDGREHLAFDDATRAIVGTLAPGALALYRLQPKADAAVPVEYYLDKGTLA